MFRPPLVFAAVLLYPLSFAAPALAAPLAILAAADGNVVISSAREAGSRASFGRALERGDRVRVGDSGSATVVFNDGHIVQLAAGGSLTIGASAGTPAQGSAAVPGEVYAQVSKYVTSGSRQKGLVALSALRSGSDSDGLPLILTPRMTDLIDARPEFRWRAVTGAQRYRVTLSGDGGELWTRETTTTRLDYPGNAEPLAHAGDYLVRVEAWSDRGRLREEETTFHVLDAARGATIRERLERITDGAGGPGSPATHFLAGSYLYGCGLLSEAAAHFDTLARLAPESPSPHEALGNAYRAMGLMDMAAAEFKTALTLTR